MSTTQCLVVPRYLAAAELPAFKSLGPCTLITSGASSEGTPPPHSTRGGGY